MIQDHKFTAPSIALEAKLINLCVNDLELRLGDFWYEWFNSNKKNNVIISLFTDRPGLASMIQTHLGEEFSVEKIFSIKEINITDYVRRGDFSYTYMIHFKLKDEDLESNINNKDQEDQNEEINWFTTLAECKYNDRW